MTFYIDIILLENIIMNFIILFTTANIINERIKTLRLILASLLGSIYAVMSYVSQVEIYMNQITKLVLSITMVYISFIPHNIKRLIKEMLFFYLTSFSFGGASYYLLYYISPKQINNINGILIGSYPIKIAVLGGILGFFIIYVSFKIVKSRLNKNTIFYDVEIVINNKKCMARTILDTGNLLVDPITSAPVIIVEKSVIEEIISKDILKNILELIKTNDYVKIPNNLKTRCRFIPFSSIGKMNGMIVGIKPDYIELYEEGNKIIKKNVIIGITNNALSKKGEYSGLIGLECLNNEIEDKINLKSTWVFNKK